MGYVCKITHGLCVHLQVVRVRVRVRVCVYRCIFILMDTGCATAKADAYIKVVECTHRSHVLFGECDCTFV